MHYVIHCLDREQAVQDRLDLYDEHKSYLASYQKVETLISGPLLADDGETMIGSLFVVRADDVEDVRAFNQGDPFNRNGIWEKVNIHPFSKRVDNR